MNQRTYRPSQAHYWTRCPRQPYMVENVKPQPSGDPAREGTCAAWVAEKVFDGTYSECAELIGETHSNGWLVDRVMADHCQSYVDLVTGLGGSVVAEELVTASVDPLIRGSLDSSSLTVVDGVLYILDLKYGFKPVDVFKNPQLIIYGRGKLHTYPHGTIRKIVLGIYQPRGFHRDGVYRTWEITPDELEAEFYDIWLAAKECESPDALCKPGTWCTNCDAASSCVALSETAYNIILTVQTGEQRNMTASELSTHLRFIKDGADIVNAAKKAVETEATERARNESIPGWAMSKTFGNRRFTEGGVTVELLTGVNPYVTDVLATPAEIERRGKAAGIDDIKDRVAAITNRSETGFKIRPVDDQAIAKAFASNNP